MDNQLAVITEEEKALLASLDLGIGGMENLEDGDIGMPPRLRISQPTRPVQVDGKDMPGVFFNSLTGDYWEGADGMEIVVLMFLPHTRVMWPVDYNKDNKPLCKSDDGKFSSSGTEQRSEPCATCPMAQWGQNDEKPLCGMQRNFLVWIVESEEAAIFTLSSSALRVAKKLSSIAMQTGIKKSINMSLVLNDAANGRWYSPTFRAGENFTVQQLVKLAEVKAGMKNLIITADDDRASEPTNTVPPVDTPDEDMGF